MRTEKLSFWTSIGFLVIGIFLLFTIFLAMKEPPSVPPSPFALIGSFLYDSFLYLAFYVPLYFFCSSIILLKDDFRKDLLFALNMGIFPFFTLSLALRTLLRPETSTFLLQFRESFGAAGAGALFMLLAVLEIVLIIQLTRRLFHREDTAPAADRPAEGRTDTKPAAAEPAARPGPGGPDAGDGGRRKFMLLQAGEDGLFGRSAGKSGPEENAPAAAAEGTADPEAETAPPLETGILEELLPAETPAQAEAAAETPAPAEAPRPAAAALMPARAAADEKAGDPAGNAGFWTDSEVETYTGPGCPSYELSPDELLNEYPDGQYWKIDNETQNAGDILRHTLEEFKIQAEVTGIRKGPVITMFEILPAPGVKLSKIVNLSDNIALRLAASSVRIVAPIPGKHAVGIEVPNRKRSIVSFKEMLGDDSFQDDDYMLPIVLGKDIAGEGQIIDLTQTPHLLIAGATGSGKSVCVNSIICSLLFRKSPEEVKLLLIDPKIVELKLYNDIPHLLTPVVTEPKRAFQALQYCLYEMERRYALLDAMGVRDIAAYNKKAGKKRMTAEKLPYLVVIIDEFADLMASSGKELESTLARLAAMSRAVGLHLVLATQRPSIDVITGLIKANIPSRIAFMVASKFDSRIILDSIGAEKLLGKGDMLFTSPGHPSRSGCRGPFFPTRKW